MNYILSPTRRKPNTYSASVTYFSTVVIVLGLCGLLSSCGRLNEEQTGKTPQISERAEVNPQREPLLAAMLSTKDEMAVEQAISRLPPAPSVEREHVPKCHQPQNFDTITTLRYDGLNVEIYRATESGKNLLSAVTVSRNGLGSTDLDVGQPLAP